LSAKLIPAIPEPITKKSYFQIMIHACFGDKDTKKGKKASFGAVLKRGASFRADLYDVGKGGCGQGEGVEGGV
jgi:hypothetical protein